MQNIVLASSSPRRSELLKQLGIHFRTVPADIEEMIDDQLDTGDLIRSLAYAKAFHVARTIGEAALVIGADTLVMKDGYLGKPESRQHAFEMLTKLQGGWHEVVTGLAIVDSGNMKTLQGFETTRVKMRSIPKWEIDAYIDTGEPMDKAGAYAIQGLGAVFVERIEGCYFNVVGLPVARLTGMLKEFGVNILRQKAES